MKTDPYHTPEAFQNWKTACYYYFPECKDQPKPNRKGWVLHHKDPTLRHTDINRYNEWRIEDVVPMTNEEHSRLHHIGTHYKLGHKHSAESRAKMSASMKGRKAWNKGISPSDEVRKKMSEADRGTHWWNNGFISKKCKECPEGFKAGRIYKRKGA